MLKQKSIIKISLVGCDVEIKGRDNLYGSLEIKLEKAKTKATSKIIRKNNVVLSLLKNIAIKAKTNATIPTYPINSP